MITEIFSKKIIKKCFKIQNSCSSIKKDPNPDKKNWIRNATLDQPSSNSKKSKTRNTEVAD